MKQKKKRKGIGNSLRFKILTRDGFVCRYCGRGAKDNITLEVDHIVSVKEGGDNEEINLITSCFECNRGKSKKSLSVSPLDVSAIVDEREKKITSYIEYKAKIERYYEQKKVLSQDTVKLYINETLNEKLGFTLKDEPMKKFSKLVGSLCSNQFYEAIDITLKREIKDQEAQFRYLCGVLWHMKRDSDPTLKARQIVKDYYLNHPSEKGSDWYLDYKINPHVDRLGIDVCVEAINYIKGNDFKLGEANEHSSYFIALVDYLQQISVDE